MKKLILFVLTLACVSGLAGCSGSMVLDSMTFHIGEAAKITVTTDRADREVDIVDREFIQNMTENINSLRFEKTSAVDGSVKYAYLLTWFDTENHQIASITITEENGHQIVYDGYRYRVGAGQNVDTELIRKTLRGIA